jgi:VanZ family protein
MRGKGAMTRFARFARMGTGLTALTIVVLSIMPMRPHLLGNDYYEHLIAYFVTGSLFAIGYPRPVQLLSGVVLFVVSAGSLELAQWWIPHRTASVGGFVTATIGAWIGIVITVLVRRACERKFVVSYK